MPAQKHNRIPVAIFAVMAVLYNSWPLAYILNSPTAHYGLASDLDLPAQPYNWLFISCDVVLGISLLVVSAWLWLRYRGVARPRSWTVLLAGLAMFGLFTATSAVAPPNCHGAIPICADFYKRVIGPDGVESTLAALGLLASLVAANVLIVHSRLRPRVRRLARFTLVAWPSSAAVFLTAAATNRDVHLTQQVLLIATGLAVLVIGLAASAPSEPRSH